MRDFVKRVAQKVSKLTSEQVEQLLETITAENDLMDAVLESISTGLLVCDAAWNLIKANKAAERYLQVADQRAERGPVWGFIGDTDISDFLKTNHDRQKNNTSEEFAVKTPGGATRIVSVSIMPLVQKKRVAGNIIKIDDITEERNQETLLRRMENLASLTNLAASVAHEIKNPLGSISIHIQLIQKALRRSRESGCLPEEKHAEKYLEIVNQEIERLNQIIVDFLFAVRPIQAELQPEDITRLLKSLADFFAPELEKDGIVLQLNLAENPPRLMLDEKLFKQVVINIVQNSIAAMPSGGVLWISTRVRDDKLIFTIADNGIGMDQATLSRIFEPYYTTRANGTGLGLTMVYKIIKEFGGEIDVQSFPHDGTMFSIALPIPQKEKRLLR